MSLLGWLTILCGSSSHLSAILCFPSKATILASTLEQEYYVIYRPDEVPQNNTHSDAHHVDSDQARTINFTDDGHVEVDRGQGTSFVEDALPSADMNDADESTPVSDDGITVEAHPILIQLCLRCCRVSSVSSLAF
jgi:hypothetical protein